MKKNRVTKTVRRIGLLAVFIPVILFGITACITSYNIQAFSNDIQALPTTTIETGTFNADGTPVTKIEYEGIFKGSSYEAVMQMAYKAGYTKVLTVEYGTRHVLWMFGLKWVEIRCTKDVPAALPAAAPQSGE
ncbi:MAG: hypothetical protein FWF29_06395 [Treponema sp.]|nr:hypothetical protein [Treponema sp.]